ncbi:Protein MNN4 [Yarrowia sp. B02]|nr:Protein MNN4 [Yarrowia sp. B02]
MTKLFVILLTCLVFGSLLNFTDRLPPSVKSRVAYMTDVGLVSGSKLTNGLVSNSSAAADKPFILFTKAKYAENEKEFNPKWAQKKALDSSSDYLFQWKDWVDLTEVTGLKRALQQGSCDSKDDCLSQLKVTGPPTEIQPKAFFNRIGKVYLDQTMPRPKRLIYLTEKESRDKREHSDDSYPDSRDFEKSRVPEVRVAQEGDFSKSRDAKSIKNVARDHIEFSESRDLSREKLGSRDIEFSQSDPVHEDSYDDDDNGTILVPTAETEVELQEFVDLDVASKSYLSAKPRSRDQKYVDLPLDMFTWDIHEEIDRGLSQPKDAESAVPAEQLSHSTFLSQQWKSINKSGKHFSEAWVVGDAKGAGVHYDWRFFTEFNTVEEKRVILRKLVRAWLDFTSRERIITWLAHGTLLGWYWNGQSLPWDFDGDVQMPIREFDRFARLYNQSLVIDENGGRFYVDVGPAYVERLRGNGKNVIDARFIDVDSGMYIDITALAYAEQQHKFHCKNWHRYLIEDVSPLRRTLFEGKEAYVPNNFDVILTSEYKKEPLTNTRFEGHLWNKYLRLWVQQDQCEMLQIEENVEEKALRGNGEPSTFGACYRPEYLERYKETEEMGKKHEKEMEAIRMKGDVWEHIQE